MITRDDIDSFLDDEDALTDFYGAPEDAFEDMNDTLVVEEPFAALFAEEQEDFFQFAYHYWMEYLGQDGVDWKSMFYVWLGDE